VVFIGCVFNQVDCNYLITDDSVHTFNSVNKGKVAYAFLRLDLKKGEVVPDTENSAAEVDEKKVVSSSDDSDFTSFEKGTYAEFYKKITSVKDPRFCVITFKVIEPKDNRKVSKSCLILWCPGTSPIKQKMISAGTFQKLCAKLNPLKKLEAHDTAAISYERILENIL